MHGELAVLDALRACAPCTSGELAARSGIDPAVTSRLLHDLRERGLVARRPMSRQCDATHRAALVWEPNEKENP